MKKNLFFVLAALVFVSASSFTLLNDCGTFEQFQQGVTYTMTSYDAKGKVNAINNSKVTKVETGTESTKATIDFTATDAKGKESGKGQFELTCAGGGYKMDMKSLITPQQKDAYKDMQLTLEGDMLEYPANMTAGMALTGGTVTMDVTDNGQAMNHTTIVIKDRKCVAVESRTTPAGTWECYKITYTSEITTKVGMMTLPIKPRTCTEWFSFKVGVVRTESYREDKLEGYSELTAFKKPQ